MLYVVEDIGKRDYFEDAHSVKIKLYKDYDYVSIFDGHGGDAVANYLKFHLKDYVKKHLVLGKPPKLALHDAFQEAHNSLPKSTSYMTGSAVVVILRKQDMIWVANCGDSRAILSTTHIVIPLSDDHKPNRKDEHIRITQLGGTVTFNENDVPRVQGNLALSRSIGDKYLHPYVICDPEILEMKLDNSAQYIVLMTDGITDVLSNMEVCDIIDTTILRNTSKQTKKLLHECNVKLLQESRIRGSQDNVTIMLWML